MMYSRLYETRRHIAEADAIKARVFPEWRAREKMEKEKRGEEGRRGEKMGEEGRRGEVKR